MNGGPLSGIRVLDLSRVLAAPYATMALGELGAEVIKVERPPDGDETRQWSPPFIGTESTYFLAINRNKRSIALDFENVEDRALVEELAVGWADVIVENFKPGTLERWGLGLDRLRQANARLVTATVRGYPVGDNRPGYDFVIQAGGGLMSITGPVTGEPSKVGVAVADILAGLFLVAGIEAALVRRERTGRGNHVDVSLWESQLAALTTVVQGYLSTGTPPQRWGNAHAQLMPYQTFKTQEGWMAIGVGNNQQFAQLCQVVGHEEWSQDARFRTNPERVAHRTELESLLASVFMQKSTQYWSERLESQGIPHAPLRTVPEALDFAQEAGHDLIGQVAHETLGGLAQIRMPWRFADSETGMGLAPPTLDQHRDEVMALVRTLRQNRKDENDRHE